LNFNDSLLLELNKMKGSILSDKSEDKVDLNKIIEKL
jgi:hypothetical protein